MAIGRIVSIKEDEIIKGPGLCSLEDEIQRINLFSQEGIKVPKFLGYTGENYEYGRFERIFGYHKLFESEEVFYQRGQIQGILGNLGYWHPLYSISFDDTILTEEGDLYLIDPDKQREICNKEILVDRDTTRAKEDFLVRVIPSMNYIEMDSKGLPAKVIEAHQEGYINGIGENIRLDKILRRN